MKKIKVTKHQLTEYVRQILKDSGLLVENLLSVESNGEEVFIVEIKDFNTLVGNLAIPGSTAFGNQVETSFTKILQNVGMNARNMNLQADIGTTFADADADGLTAGIVDLGSDQKLLVGDVDDDALQSVSKINKLYISYKSSAIIDKYGASRNNVMIPANKYTGFLDLIAAKLKQNELQIGDVIAPGLFGAVLCSRLTRACNYSGVGFFGQFVYDEQGRAHVKVKNKNTLELVNVGTGGIDKLNKGERSNIGIKVTRSDGLFAELPSNAESINAFKQNFLANYGDVKNLPMIFTDNAKQVKLNLDYNTEKTSLPGYTPKQTEVVDSVFARISNTIGKKNDTPFGEYAHLIQTADLEDIQNSIKKNLAGLQDAHISLPGASPQLEEEIITAIERFINSAVNLADVYNEGGLNLTLFRKVLFPQFQENVLQLSRVFDIIKGMERNSDSSSMSRSTVHALPRKDNKNDMIEKLISKKMIDKNKNLPKFDNPKLPLSEKFSTNLVSINATR